MFHWPPAPLRRGAAAAAGPYLVAFIPADSKFHAAAQRDGRNPGQGPTGSAGHHHRREQLLQRRHPGVRRQNFVIPPCQHPSFPLNERLQPARRPQRRPTGHPKPGASRRRRPITAATTSKIDVGSPTSLKRLTVRRTPISVLQEIASRSDRQPHRSSPRGACLTASGETCGTDLRAGKVGPCPRIRLPPSSARRFADAACDLRRCGWHSG